MSNDPTDGLTPIKLDAMEFGEHSEDNWDDNQNQGSDSESSKHHNQLDNTKDQIMDQAIEKKPLKPLSQEAERLGVTWTEGSYSGKNLRSTCMFIWLVTIFFVGIGIYLMVTGKMGDHGTLYWSLLLIIPVCVWIYFGAVYFYRTTTIHYRLTQHHFSNEKGLFTKTKDTLELINIEDMKLQQTLVDRLVNGGTGTVILLSNDKTDPELKIKGLEAPNAAFESINTLRQRARNARVIRSVNS